MNTTTNMSLLQLVEQLKINYGQFKLMTRNDKNNLFILSSLTICNMVVLSQIPMLCAVTGIVFCIAGIYFNNI